METSIVWKVLTITGVTTWIGAMLLNVANWKGDLLFWAAVIIGAVRFGFYCWKTWQIVRMNELDIKERQKKLQKK